MKIFKGYLLYPTGKKNIKFASFCKVRHIDYYKKKEIFRFYFRYLISYLISVLKKYLDVNFFCEFVLKIEIN